MNVGEYSPIGSMVKDQKLSLCVQTRRGRTPIFTYVLSQILLNVLYNLWGSMGSLKCVFFWCVNISSLAHSLISCIYGAVVTSQNGGDKAQT